MRCGHIFKAIFVFFWQLNCEFGRNLGPASETIYEFQIKFRVWWPIPRRSGCTWNQIPLPLSDSLWSLIWFGWRLPGNRSSRVLNETAICSTAPWNWINLTPGCCLTQESSFRLTFIVFCWKQNPVLVAMLRIKKLTVKQSGGSWQVQVSRLLLACGRPPPPPLLTHSTTRTRPFNPDHHFSSWCGPAVSSPLHGC